MHAIYRFTGEHGFLSNFHRSTVMYDYHFPDRVVVCAASAEHAFQAAKAVRPQDGGWIFASASPAEAKRRGRTIECRPDWDQVKKRIMLQVVLAKFTQNPDLAGLLAATGGRKLIEGNTWGDDYWGMTAGPGRRQPGVSLWTAPDGTQYQGLNYLGQILMAVRLVLRDDTTGAKLNTPTVTTLKGTQ